MATLEQRIRDLTLVIATESKRLGTYLNGRAADNSALKTVAKGNLLAAINELYDLIMTVQANNGAQIDDASTTSTTKTYSVSKILSTLAAAVSKIDTNNDGIVNAADSAAAVPWTGVTGKPTQFPPAPFDASLVASGVLDIARIPILPSQLQIVSSGDLTALTAGQQSQIGQGTVVTVVDGTRYVYSGTGSKTSGASYVTLADITPDWSTISSKPTTRAGYGITDAQALDATLTALAGVTTAANQLIYATGSDTFATATLTAFARNILDDADAASVRATIAAYGAPEIGNPDTDFASVFTAGLT